MIFKKISKVILAALLSAVMILPFTVFAVDSDTSEIFTVDGIRYRILDDTQTVEVIHSSADEPASNLPDSSYSGDVTIPGSVTNSSDNTTYTVVGIDTMAFLGAKINSISLPEGLQYIDGAAFASSSLTSITIPVSVTRLGGGDNNTPVFFNGGNGSCAIESIKFAEGSQLTTISDGAFDGCDSLDTLEIPAGVTDLGLDNIASNGSRYLGVLDGWKNAKNVTFADGSPYTKTENDVLYKGDTLCVALDVEISSVTVKEGTKTIADCAFYTCTKLATVNLPEGLETIGDGAFNYAPNVNVTLPSIPGMTINVAGSTPANVVTQINIPSTVTSIGQDFLKGGLKEDGSSVVIFQGTTPPTIGEGVFAGKSDQSTALKIIYPADCGYTDSSCVLAGYITETPGGDSTYEYALTLASSSASVYVGKTTTLTAESTVPTGASLVWSSSNKSVATVDNGTVTGVKNGTATITASITLNDVTLVSQSCTVTVTTETRPTITITAQDVTAYTGGDSISSDPFPTARYKVEADEGVDLSKVTFTVDEKTYTLDAQSGDVMPLSWLTEGFTLQPAVTKARVALFAAPETAKNDGTAGTYEISAINWDDVSASVNSTDVDLQFEPGTLTVRNVSDPAAVLENEVDIAKPVVSSERDVDTSDGLAVAVIPADASYRTNGKEALGVLGTSDADPLISLLFDDLLDRETVSGAVAEDMLTDRAAEEGFTMTEGQYELKYLDLINEHDGNAWVSTDGDITIFWPYPDAIKRNYSDYTFSVLHFEGLHREYQINSSEEMQALVGKSHVELISAAKTTQGVKFTLSGDLDNGSFSPFALIWTKDSTGGSPSSGSTTYAVSVEESDGGTITVSPKRAEKGDTVTITVTPDKGYELDELIVTDKNGDELRLTEKSGNKFTFKMPASKVTVEAFFVEIEAGNKDEPSGVIDVELPFLDVAEGQWFADAVKYVYANGLMSGTSATAFDPGIPTNRAMIATILYRLEGQPPVSAAAFSDVGAGQWYSDAVAWASASLIVTGYGDGRFGPEDPITRQDLAVMLYRYASYKGYDITQGGMAIREYSDYESISDYAVTAMTWAVNAGLLNGSGGALSPTGSATRAEVAQILMRFCQNIVK